MTTFGNYFVLHCHTICLGVNFRHAITWAAVSERFQSYSRRISALKCAGAKFLMPLLRSDQSKAGFHCAWCIMEAPWRPINYVRMMMLTGFITL